VTATIATLAIAHLVRLEEKRNAYTTQATASRARVSGYKVTFLKKNMFARFVEELVGITIIKEK
jgi:hypothetical protein